MSENAKAAVHRQLERYILCVDDDLDFLKSIEFFLPEQIAGTTDGVAYRFVFIGEPVEALETLADLIREGETVAMLISDHQMPNMNGTEFLTRARRLAPDTTRILLTGHAGIDSAIRAINEQLLDKYVTKPIDIEHDFVLTVRHLLQRFDMQLRVREQDQLIRGLFEFANTLNAMVDVTGVVEHTTAFTKLALHGQEVHVLLDVPQAVGEDMRSPRTGPRGVVPPRHGPRPGGTDGIEFGVASALDREWPWFDFVAARTTEPLGAGPMAYAALGTAEEFLGLIVVSRLPGAPAFTEEALQTLCYVARTSSVALQNQNRLSRLEAISRARAESLEQAEARLAIIDQVKSDFLAFVSHELRTPLNHMSAIGMVDGDLDPREFMNMVDIVRSGYDRLERFVIKSLEYFEWLAIRLDVPDETSDMVRAATSAIASVRHKASESVQIEFSIPEGDCHARIAAPYAEDMIRIMLDNAIKFSEREARVRVEVARDSDRIALTVTDEGRGFPPEWAREIFRPFTIVDATHHSEGSALNLAKVAAMVEAYGGTIRARSEGPGKGASFTVELIAKAVPAIALQLVPSGQIEAHRFGSEGPEDAAGVRKTA